jgi:hypothetical protein
VTQRVLPTGPFFEGLRNATFDVAVDFNCQSVVNPLLDVGKFLPRSVTRGSGPSRSPNISMSQEPAEDQFIGIESLLQKGKEQPTEETSEHADGQKESGPTGDPMAAVGRETATGDDAMQVRVMAPTPTIP